MPHLEVNGLPVGTAPGRVLPQALPPDYPGLQPLEFETAEDARECLRQLVITRPRLVDAEVVE
jgi:hypothetical protein